MEYPNIFYTLSRKQWLELHNKGTIKAKIGPKTFNLFGPGKGSYNLIGSRNSKAACVGTDFSLKGEDYKNGLASLKSLSKNL